jgi:hypothetical protein
VSTGASTDPPPSERVRDVPRILNAMNQGIREALLRHKQAGVPIIVWRLGRVEEIAPEDIEIDATDSTGNTSPWPGPATA